MGFVNNTYNDFTYLSASNISVTHAFSTRFGEPNSGRFSDESMEALCGVLNIPRKSVVFSKQVHGSKIQIITHSTFNSQLSTLNSQLLNEADALVTDVPGIALMVFTADCIPVLLYDPVQKAIGAVHAGWRGTSLGIAAKTAEAMTNAFGCMPENIQAAIGPGISGCCYETGADVARALSAVLPDTSIATLKTDDTSAPPKYMVDLKEANRQILCRAGVQEKNIAVSSDCTYCAENGSKYWSHRRHGKNRSTQAAIIQLGIRN